MSVVINGSGTITGVPGSVLQVVSSNYSSEIFNSSGSYQDTGLGASITPTSATSKILVLVSQPSLVQRQSNGGIRLSSQLVRNSTPVCVQISSLGGQAATGAGGLTAFYGEVSYCYLDSPATTSSVVYKIQNSIQFAEFGYLCSSQSSGSTSTITLIEIAA